MPSTPWTLKAVVWNCVTSSKVDPCVPLISLDSLDLRHAAAEGCTPVTEAALWPAAAGLMTAAGCHRDAWRPPEAPPQHLQGCFLPWPCPVAARLPAVGHWLRLYLPPGLALQQAAEVLKVRLTLWWQLLHRRSHLRRTRHCRDHPPLPVPPCAAASVGAAARAERLLCGRLPSLRLTVPRRSAARLAVTHPVAVPPQMQSGPDCMLQSKLREYEFHVFFHNNTRL